MILHYVISPYETSAGVRKKIDQQIKAFKFHQIHVEKVLLPTTSLPSFNNTIMKILALPLFLGYYLYNDFIQNFFLINYFRTLPSDHAIYMRMPVPSLMTWIFFRKNKRRMIIVEHQSREMREYLMKGNLIYPIVDWLFGEAIRSLISIQIAVTKDIMEYQKRRNPNQVSTRFIVIPNGIDTTIVPIRTNIPPLRDNIEFLFLGDIKYWHGLDRLIAGLEQYSGEYSITLAIYGNNLQHPLRDYSPKNQKVILKIYPIVSNRELDDTFETAHIAVSSLGVHRIRINNFSPLKSREYCSRGVPFIFSTKDLDFPRNFSFSREFPADESPIPIHEVIQFIEEVYKDDIFSSKMHEYAKEHLEWTNKLKPLVDLIRSYENGR